jgi:hypothetical protein
MPVHVGNGAALYRAAQLKEPLLCVPCEQRVGVWDRVGADTSLQLDDTFPARASAKANIIDADARVGLVPDLDTEALTRFAVSVLWRASESTILPAVKFGARYAEEFRRYLASDLEPFPRRAVLAVHVIDREDGNGGYKRPRTDRVATEPTQGKPGRLSVHEVKLFGLEFQLMLGNIPDADKIREACFLRTQRVFLNDGDRLLGDAKDLVARSPAKGRLARDAGK